MVEVRITYREVSKGKWVSSRDYLSVGKVHTTPDDLADHLIECIGHARFNAGLHCGDNYEELYFPLYAP